MKRVKTGIFNIVVFILVLTVSDSHAGRIIRRVDNVTIVSVRITEPGLVNLNKLVQIKTNNTPPGGTLSNWTVTPITGTATIDVNGVLTPTSLGKISVTVQYDIGTFSVTSIPFDIDIIELYIQNSRNPTQGVPNDSDDYFFGDGNPVRIYYTLNVNGTNLSDVRLLVRNNNESITFSEIDLDENNLGTNRLATWSIPAASGFNNEWDYQLRLQVTKNPSLLSNPQQVQDLFYKHRPIIYLHQDEFSGPINVEPFMQNSDIINSTNGGIEKQSPINFDDLAAWNDNIYYMNLNNTQREHNENDDGAVKTVYFHHAIHNSTFDGSVYIFLQYWFFTRSSFTVDNFLGGRHSYCHEGDWEMMQIAVKIDEVNNELNPIGATASQHFYGQTLKWNKECPLDLGPESRGQDYVDKIGHRPKIYVARKTHATYFRPGRFVTWLGGEGIDLDGNQVQYLLPNIFSTLDYTEADREYSYQLTRLTRIIRDWRGKWGDNSAKPNCEKLPGPNFRKTGSTTDGYINLLNEPRTFYNHYLKIIRRCGPPWPIIPE